MLNLNTLPKLLLLSIAILSLASGCAEKKDEEEAPATELGDMASPDEIGNELANSPTGIHENNNKVETHKTIKTPKKDDAVPEQMAETPDPNNEQDETKVSDSETKKPTLVIIVSKKKQRLWIYENGSNKPSYSWLVSTGSERSKCPPKGKCYIAHTPSGEFTPTRAYRYYTSNKWKAKMDFAVFFNGGIALHATYGASHLEMLGRKDSGGCVRQSEEHAAITYKTVQEHGLENTRVIVED